MTQTYQLSPVAELIAKVESAGRVRMLATRKQAQQARFPRRGRRLLSEKVIEREAMDAVHRAHCGEFETDGSDAQTCSECGNGFVDCTCLEDDSDRIDFEFCRHCGEDLSFCECYAVRGDEFPEFGHGRVLYLAPIEEFIRDLVFCTDPAEFADDVAEINSLFGTDYDVDSIKLHSAFWEANVIVHDDYGWSDVFIDDGFYLSDEHEFADSELGDGDIDDDVRHDAFMDSIFGDEDGTWPRPQKPGRWVVLTGGRRKKVKSHVGSNIGVWQHPNEHDRVKVAGGRRGFAPVEDKSAKSDAPATQEVVRRYHRQDLVEMSRRAAAAHDLARDAVKRAERNAASEARCGRIGYSTVRTTQVYSKSAKGRMELQGKIVHVGRRETRYDVATPEEQRRDRLSDVTRFYH